MKSSKFWKALSALGLGAMMTASVFGMAACDPDTGLGDEGNGGNNGGGETNPTQLATPVISLDETNKKITWSAVDHATGYKVYENNTEKTSVTVCEYDLSGLTTPDTYAYYVIATSTSEDYTDSQKSNVVNYEIKGASAGNAILPEYKGPGAALTEGSATSKSELTVGTSGMDNSTGAWSNGVFSVTEGTSRDLTRSKTGVYEDGQKIDSTAYKGAIKITGSAKFSVNAAGAGTWTIYVQNGSTGSDTQTLVLTDAQGQTSNINYPGKSDNNNTQKVTITLPAAGTYSLTCGGTSWIYYSCVEATVNNTPIERIEVVNKGKSDYLLTQKLDCTGIIVNAIHATTGKISEVNLSNVEFDTSDYNAGVSGTYSVGVSYTVEGNLTSTTTTFTTTYEVKVYTVSSIKLDTTLTSGNKQTTLKQAYLPNESLDTAGLTVTATGTLGSDSVEFVMKAADYTVTAPDLTTEGKKQVKVSVAKEYASGATVEQSYNIVVKSKKTPADDKVEVTVGETGEFATVTQALCYLKACNYGATVEKVLNIADGEYYEKISIDMPNVHLVGSATNTPDATTDNGVVLWYDAAAGLTDPAGVAYGTNGSSSVTITSAADKFVAENITFKNYYNTAELYYQLKAEISNTQSVALLVESNSAIFTNCKMSGYHDTLYANKGYHFYKNCWIEGRTDYIFGQDAIPYFYQCTIYTVSAGNKDGDGGYIAAYQNNSNEYGPVFNGCTITGPETGATNIALGRPWGKEFKMVTLNCKISGNYSKAPHTSGTQKGQRYVTMSGNEPKAANMLEYNNTGLDGETPDLTAEQITALEGTCTIMTSDVAAKYQIENVATLLKFNPLA